MQSVEFPNVVFPGGKECIDLSDYCRLCLQLPDECDLLDLQLIYDEEENLSYYECFTICTQLDLRAGGTYAPHQLCKSCGLELQVAYDFHKKVEESKKFLVQFEKSATQNNVVEAPVTTIPSEVKSIQQSYAVEIVEGNVDNIHYETRLLPLEPLESGTAPEPLQSEITKEEEDVTSHFQTSMEYEELEEQVDMLDEYQSVDELVDEVIEKPFKLKIKNQRKLLDPQREIINRLDSFDKRLNNLENRLNEKKIEASEQPTQSKSIRECKTLLDKVHSSICKMTGEDVDPLQTEIASTLPFDTLAAAKEFETKLLQQEYVEAMKTFFLRIKGNEASVDNLLRRTYTDDFLSFCTWGVKGTKQPLSQFSIVSEILYDAETVQIVIDEEECEIREINASDNSHKEAPLASDNKHDEARTINTESKSKINNDSSKINQLNDKERSDEFFEYANSDNDFEPTNKTKNKQKSTKVQTQQNERAADTPTVDAAQDLNTKVVITKAGVVRKRKRFDGQYSCDYCKKIFKNRSRMLTHRRTHEPDRPKYKCEECGRLYATKQAKGVHMDMVHNMTGLKCTICDKAFAVKKLLDIHMRYHTGDFPYACDLCERKFAQMCHLTTHKNVKHNSERFACEHPGCGKFFTSSSALRNHEFLHSEMPFECAYCQRGYPSKSKIKVHIRQKHGFVVTLEELEDMRKFHVMRSKLNLVKITEND